MYDHLEQIHDPEDGQEQSRPVRSDQHNFGRVRPPKAVRGRSQKKGPEFGGMRLRRNKRWNW